MPKKELDPTNTYDMLQLLKDRFPNKLPTNENITLDQVRGLQGIQKAIDYIEMNLVAYKQREERMD